ncbi:MAG: hypothetical protein QXU32_02595 [Nitrososphaerales archaeon]
MNKQNDAEISYHQSSFTQNIKTIFEKGTFYWLIIASIVLLIVSIGSISFYQFPPDALYYMQSLPIYYWIGVSIAILAIVMSRSAGFKDHFKLIPHLILGMYLFGFPSMTYENPRFMDVYVHSSGALSILKNGTVDQYSYSADYPLGFLLMTTNLLVTDIDPLIFLKIFHILVPLLAITLIYVFAKSFSSKYSVYAPLAFSALFFQDQGHFSPQAFALPLYIILWIFLGRLWLKKDISREAIIAAIVTLIAINMSSPTTSYFLLFNLVSVSFLTLLLARFLLGKGKKITSHSTSSEHGRIIHNVIYRSDLNRKIMKILPILLLHAILLLSWSIYAAEKRGIEKIVDKINADFARLMESTYNLPLSPDSSYAIVVNTIAAVTFFVAISSLIFCALLLKHRKSEINFLAIMAGMIVGSLVILPIASFQSATLSQRVTMFAIIPWSVLFASFIASDIKYKWSKGMKVTALILVIIIAMLIPITKYGSEPTTYVNTSEMYLADLITKNSPPSTILTLRTGEFIFKYFGVNNDNDVKTARIATKSIIDEELIQQNVEQHITSKRHVEIAITNMENNIYKLKYLSEENVYTEYLQKRFNLIANSGSQIYVPLPHS